MSLCLQRFVIWFLVSCHHLHVNQSSSSLYHCVSIFILLCQYLHFYFLNLIFKIKNYYISKNIKFLKFFYPYDSVGISQTSSVFVSQGVKIPCRIYAAKVSSVTGHRSRVACQLPTLRNSQNYHESRPDFAFKKLFLQGLRVPWSICAATCHVSPAACNLSPTRHSPKDHESHSDCAFQQLVLQQRIKFKLHHL